MFKDKSSKYSVALLYLLLALTTLVPFAQVYNYEFVSFDDNLYITDNTRVQAGLTWPGIKSGPSRLPTFLIGIR
jgi:hypothetical protein